MKDSDLLRLEKKRVDGRKYYMANREKILKKAFQFRIDNPEKVRERQRKFRASNTDKAREVGRRYYIANREKLSMLQRQVRMNVKMEVLEKYGGKCVCCGENEMGFLTVDHINGGGTEHRKKIGRGNGMYKWLQKNGYPKDGFQLLCYNCNCGRDKNGGVCPHTQSVTRVMA